MRVLIRVQIERRRARKICLASLPARELCAGSRNQQGMVRLLSARARWHRCCCGPRAWTCTNLLASQIYSSSS